MGRYRAIWPFGLAIAILWYALSRHERCSTIVATLERGFKSRRWFTFRQALALKACVRKGERGSYVVFYSELSTKDDNDDASETRRILRVYTVFNADQIDGLPPQFYAPPETEAIPASPTHEDEARLSALFARIPVTIRYGGNRAFYSKAADVIQMPPRAAFRDYTQFFSTLAHEASHNAALRIMPHGYSGYRKYLAFELV